MGGQQLGRVPIEISQLRIQLEPECNKSSLGKKHPPRHHCRRGAPLFPTVSVFGCLPFGIWADSNTSAQHNDTCSWKAWTGLGPGSLRCEHVTMVSNVGLGVGLDFGLLRTVIRSTNHVQQRRQSAVRDSQLWHYMGGSSIGREAVAARHRIAGDASVPGVPLAVCLPALLLCVPQELMSGGLE